MLEQVLGRIWASTRILDDHAAICAAGGRFCGTDSETQAREFLAARLAEIVGSEPTREPIPYRGWSRGPASVGLPDGRRFPAQGLVRSPSTPAGGLRAPLVDLGRGTADDIARAGTAVKGAIVLVRHEFMMGTGHLHRRFKYELARAAGAAGFLIANCEPGGLPVTGSSGDGSPGHIPCAGISHEDGAALSAIEGETITLTVEGRFEDRTSYNLLADIPGRTDEMVVLSAHIDGHDLAQSAIDNGSGLTAALAAASAVRDLVPGLRRGLQIGFFTVEEWALLGSRDHLARLGSNEKGRLVFNINLDSVAGAARLTALTSGVPGISRFIRDALAPAGLSIGQYAPFMGNSDHANYVRNGIPALRLCAGFDEPRSNMRFLLTPADTRDKVHPHELKTAASVTAALILAACSAETLPGRLDPETALRIAGP